jgi:hypothetical protein
MATQKTRPTGVSVAAYVKSIDDPKRRTDCITLVAIMKKATGSEPAMWGSSIIGFGACHIRYESGREADWCRLGFSPRKGALSLYLCGGLDRFQDLLGRLGKHKTGKGCLYIKSLEDIHLPALTALLKKAAKEIPAGATSAD